MYGTCMYKHTRMYRQSSIFTRSVGLTHAHSNNEIKSFAITSFLKRGVFVLSFLLFISSSSSPEVDSRKDEEPKSQGFQNQTRL